MQYVTIIGHGHRISDLDDERGQCKEPLYELPDGAIPIHHHEGVFLNDAIRAHIDKARPIGTATVSFSWDGEVPDRVEGVDFDSHFLPYEDEINVILVYSEEYLDARDGPVVESAPHELDYGI